MRQPKTISDWQEAGEKALASLLRKARKTPGVGSLGPRASWKAELRMVSGAVMTGLNSRYRGKRKPTDVLSFPAPAVFARQGILGELVICVPVMKRQARELGHDPTRELSVLLAHGLLHLLGLDHENSPREAARMASLEARLLRARSGARSGAPAGLIRRSG